MILVTGASGLVGSHLVALLATLESDTEIIASYNHTIPATSYPNVTYKKCNLLDIFEVEEIMEGITEVYHCAAIVSFNPKDKHTLVHNNQVATANLVDKSIAQQVRKFIHVSSIATIGREHKLDKDQLYKESHIWEEGKKRSVYSRSKFYAEMEVWRGFASGLNGAIINPGIILGEGDWGRSSSKLMQTVAKGMKWYTKGVTAFVDVKDVAKSMYTLMKSEVSNERFIISEGNHSYETIFQKMATALQIKGPQKEAKKWMSEIIWRVYRIQGVLTGNQPLVTKETAQTAQSHYHFDNKKFLSYFPTFQYEKIENTIARMAAVYVSQPKMQ